MKKLLSIAVVLLTVLVLVLVFPTEAVTSDVLYVSDTGSADNTGLSPDKALKSLTDAVAKLPDEGGTVVLCGDVTIDSTAPVFAAKTGKVTVTGSYAGVDYEPQIILATSANMYMQFRSEIEFNNLTFNRTNGYWCEFVTGPKLIFGEGLVFTKNGNALTFNSVTMMVRLGYSNAATSPNKKCDNAYFEMHSGKINYIQGGNKWNHVGNATIKMYGSATVTDHVQCGGVNYNVDSVNLLLDGVDIPELYIGGYAGSANNTSITKNVSVTIKDSHIGTMQNARPIYGSSTGAVFGTLDGEVSITLDNTGVDTIDMTGGTIKETANIGLTLKNQESFTITDTLSWLDSLTVSDNSFVYINADYAGPAAVSVADGSTLLLSSTLNSAADVPAGATLAHKYVMTMNGDGSYTLTCTDETCGADTVTKTAGELNVVYLDGTAATCGDGSLLSNPVNSLDAAYARLKDEGGTIVVMGGFTINKESSKDHEIFEWPTKTGKVIITGKYNGTSYNPTIIFNSNYSFTVQFRSPTEFSHMTFNRTYGGSVKYTQFATGPDLTFGEGLVMLRAGNAMDNTNAFVTRCGYAAKAPTDKTASFTMHSGTLNFVQGGNSWMGAGAATIYIGKNAVITDHVQVGGVSGNGVTGNVKITIDGASVPGVFLGSHGASTIKGDVEVILKNLTNTAVAVQRSGSGTDYGIDGDLSVTMENCTIPTFSLSATNHITGDVSVSLKNTNVPSTLALGSSYTVGGNFAFTTEGGTINAIAGHYGIAGNATFQMKDTTVTGNMRLGGKVTGTVTTTLDNTLAGSDLLYVQDANAASYSLTLKNIKNVTSSNSFATIDSLRLENSSVIMGEKYEGPATVAVGDGSALYISGELNQESEVPANSLTGTGKIVYLAPGSYEKGEPITMRYDDRLDVSGYNFVQILNKGTPTSFQVGYGVAENSVKDTAVITYNAATKQLVATGVGKATVVLGFEEVEITVKPAPLSLFLMIGQSNMAGSEGNPDQSVICPDGQVYSTWAMQSYLTTKTAQQFVPSALAGEHNETNVLGGTGYLADYPLNLLTKNGAGKQGMDSGFGYEWNKLTGEKVWLVNAAHGATSIGDWIVFDSDKDTVTGKEYRQVLVLFNAVLDTMTKEIKSGHYTLSHYAYYWCQGCADRIQTADWYLDKFSLLHETLKKDFARDFGDGKGVRTFESANIVPVRACGEDGMNSLEVNKQKDYMTYHDLEMNGVRIAQYYMGNSTEDAFKDVHVVCNIGEQWVWWDEARTQQTTGEFFAQRYPNGIDYPVQVGTLSVPKKPEDAKDSIHYNQVGYNEIGREAARNSIYRLHPEMAPDEEVSIKLYAWDGVTDLAGRVDTTELTEHQVVVPMVYPLYRSKELVLSGDMLHDYSTLKHTGKDYVYYSIPGCEKGTVTATVDDVTVSYTLDPKVENKTFRWETVDGKLVAVSGDGLTVNPLTLLTGTNNNGLSGASFELSESVVLRHDQPWRIEWQGAVASPNGGAFMLLASSCSTNTLDAPNILMADHSVILNRRVDDGTAYVDHGGAPYAVNDFRHLRGNATINLASSTTVYALVNEITADGNMVWLYINGQKTAALNKLYDEIEGKRGVESNEISGKDYVFGYIGAKSAGLSNVTDTKYSTYNHTLTGTLQYLQVQENRLVKTEAKAATCTADGCKEYYTDPETGKIYADASGLQETTLEDLKIPASHELTHVEQKNATATEPGNIEYWYCELCGKFFSDAAAANEISEADTVIPATGGKLGDADGDGYIDAYDASLIVKYSVGAITDDELNLNVLDLDGDGYVDAYDAALIQKFSVGAIDKFPVEGK